MYVVLVLVKPNVNQTFSSTPFQNVMQIIIGLINHNY